MSLKKNLRNFLLGAVAIVPFFGLASTQAQADVLADAILEVTDFVLASDAAGTPYTDAEIQVLSATNTANTGGIGLASVAGTLTQAGSNSISPPGDVDADVKLPAIFEGTPPAGFVDDAYNPAPIPPTTHYAYADADVVGVSIVIGGGTAGVDAQTQASSGLTSLDVGDADANTGLNASFNFIAQADGNLFVDFDFDVRAAAFVDPSVLQGSADASTSWLIRIVDETTGAATQLQPGEINITLSRNEASDGTLEVSETGHLNLLLATLIAGREYSLTIRHASFADTSLLVQRVPEPGTLLLVGGGLIFLTGIGYAKGRRRSGLQA